MRHGRRLAAVQELHACGMTAAQQSASIAPLPLCGSRLLGCLTNIRAQPALLKGGSYSSSPLVPLGRASPLAASSTMPSSRSQVSSLRICGRGTESRYSLDIQE